MQINSVAAGNAVAWYQCGWRLFSGNMLNWVLMALIFFVMVMLLAMIPFLGAIVLYLLIPVLQGGMIYAAKKADQGESIDLTDLFAAFKMDGKRNTLLALGGLMLAAMLVAAVLSVPFIGGSMLASMDEMPTTGGPMMPAFGVGGMLFSLTVGILLAMLFFYAPALVMLNNLKVVEAVKTSFSAAWKNFLPFVIFMVIYVLLAIVAAIPFGLGFLVLFPVVITASYCSYKDIFRA